MKSKKLLFAIIAILLILAALYALIYGICQYLLSDKNIKELVTSQLSAKLQRQVTISDDLTFTIGWDLAPHIVVKKVIVANAAWSKQAAMLTADEIDLVISLTRIINEDYRVNALTIVNMDLHLQTKDGQSNWDFDGDKETNFKFAGNHITLVNANISLQEDDNPPTLLHIDNLQCDMYLTSESLEFALQQFTSGSSDLQGFVNIKHNPLNIKGNFQAKRFSPHDFFSPSTGDGSYVVPHTEIPVTELRQATIDLHFNIGTIAFDKLPIQNFNFSLTTQDNILVFALDSPAQIANGTVDAGFKYNMQPETPIFNINIATTELDFSTLLESMFDKSPLRGSKFNFTSTLSSSGANLNALVNNLSGKILATAGPGSFLNASAGTTNLFSNILSGVITFDKAVATTQFTCGVMNLRVNNGVATANNGIGLEAASVNVLGSGTIDLRNGAININITPQSTSNSPLNISQFSIAQNVTISGTIAKPNVSFNPISAIVGQGTTKLATDIGGALAGGVAGVVASSVLHSTVAPAPTTASPCKTAMSSN